MLCVFAYSLLGEAVLSPQAQQAEPQLKSALAAEISSLSPHTSKSLLLSSAFSHPTAAPTSDTVDAIFSHLHTLASARVSLQDYPSLLRSHSALFAPAAGLAPPLYTPLLSQICRHLLTRSDLKDIKKIGGATAVESLGRLFRCVSNQPDQTAHNFVNN